jgi:hypothetical protein
VPLIFSIIVGDLALRAYEDEEYNVWMGAPGHVADCEVVDEDTWTSQPCDVAEGLAPTAIKR